MIDLPILTIAAMTIAIVTINRNILNLPILTNAATIITINRNKLDLPRRGASLNTGPSLQELFHSK